ncbi:hypothetical protein N0V94_009521, partial [Neodidymelliopsis sp. IMI 364377]
MARQVSRFFPAATGPPRPIIQPLDYWALARTASSPSGDGEVGDKVEKKVGNNVGHISDNVINNINIVGYSMRHLNNSNDQIKDKNINVNT